MTDIQPRTHPGPAPEPTVPQSPDSQGDGPRDFQSTPASTVTPLQRAVRRFVRNPFGMAGLAYVLVMVFLALFGQWIAPHDPNALEFQPLLGPSGENWLGTDDLGRDTASRLIDGASVSLRAGTQTVAMALIIAIPLGLIAGYKGGRVDNVLMRIMDALMSFPALVLALAIAAILGPGLGNAMIAITIVLIPALVRLARASTLAVTQETFVEASRSIGTRTHRILLHRILPSVMLPIIVASSLMVGIAMIAEASLSFLGLGTQPPDPSWGNMLRRAFTFINSDPFQMVPAGVAIALAVLSFNMLGDGLRDSLGLAETAPPRGSKRGRMGLTVVDRAESRVTPLLGGRQRSNRGTVAEPLLSVHDLRVDVDMDGGRSLTVVDGVSFDVRRGEVLGLVGESGSGKTVTALSIMRLLPSPPARVVQGEVLFDGQDLLQLPFKDMAEVRRGGISVIFQDPMSSLNPAFTVGNQLCEVVRLHQRFSKQHARARALELLELVGIPDPNSRLREYPHRLSGGMRQRVLIAMALANRPKLLIADEPTTALDVTVQAQILGLLKSLQRELDMAMVFVSHDLGVIADIADRTAVMYAGELVEQAPVEELFGAPKHPYTRKLLTASPQAAPLGGRLPFISGVVPSPGSWPAGCRFASRCDLAYSECHEAPIQLSAVGTEHTARCLRANEFDAEVTS